MPEDHLQSRKGVTLVLAAAVAWSTAPIFTRLLHLDAWTILFWRGVFGGSFIVFFLFLTAGRAGIRGLFRIGVSGWMVACLSAVAMVTFIPALQHTSVANVAIIIATQPFAAAALARIWLGEIAPTRTLSASLAALLGVAIIVGGAQGVGDYLGIGLAFLMMFACAAMTVAIRRYRDTSMVAAAAVSNFLCALITIPFAQNAGSLSQMDLLILAMFGIFQVGMGLTFFALGSRLLPSGQASLIATLETPLMPFWVWLLLREEPTFQALVGGALVMGAVIVDIVGDNRARSKIVLAQG